MNLKYLRSGSVLIAALISTISANNSIQAATTNFNWIATSAADYSVSSDWDIGAVPGDSNSVALFTSNVACDFSASDNYWVGQMSLGALNNSSGSFVMNAGSLYVSNTPNFYAVTIGGRSGAGGVGAAAQSPSAGINSVGSLTMNSGTLTVSRLGNGYYHQDAFMLGLATNSTGTFTLNGGTVNLLCGLEAGVYGAGVVNVNGGTIVDNGWFGLGRGNNSAVGSGTLNLTGGAIYILPNFSGGTVGGNGGLALDQACTNATANISGGVLWVSGISFNGSGSYNPEPRDTLNISGGTIYIGSAGIYSTGTEISSVNISGGTFHTADMIGVGVAHGVAGSTNADLLADGTNWVWTATLPVNLKSSLSVDGVTGPGYITFAPEAGRTITLNSVWSGNGGFVVNGPGTVTMAASNSYAGNTTIDQGTLALSGVGSIANSANIIVTASGTFSGPGGGAVYTLGSNQTLSNSGSTATLGGYINTGAGTVSLTYASGTPSFTVVNGTLGLSANTTVVINNTGAALADGSYQIISTGSGGVITAQGSLPGVTVIGGGIAPGESASLSLLNNELYLTVTSSQPPTIANVVTNSLYFGSTWQISIANLASLAGWSDPNGLALSLTGVGPLSANGTNMMTDGTNIYYLGTLSANDYFNYTISDGTLSAVGTVVLNELDPTAAIPADTNFVTSLNGLWRFYFERTNYNLGTAPNVILPLDSQAFQNVNYVEGSSWTNLPVPGNWEMYGLSPCTYFVPDDTCGLYRNWIQIPQSWQGRRVYLNFDGVMEGAEVWLNGQPVPVSEPSWNIPNYHESGWTSFQVDLTSQVNFGTTNLLAVRVIKSTPADDLETGDYFVLGGIDRPVALYSVPQTNFADVQMQTHLLGGTNSAQVTVTADVSSGNSSTTVAMILNGVETDTTATNGQAVFTQIINQPKLWSAEFPNLYTLTMELKDGNGQVTETVTNRIGIREITIVNGVVLLNGVPIKFAGVGTHDSTPTNGSVAGASFWRSEILKMKAANINAIRTCHYTYDSAFYDACDELGMYVSDELPYCWCDNETPAASFQGAFEQRARETIRRDRNHPSVMIWAIGNENTAGNNLQDVANLVHSLDATRPRLVSTFNASTYNVELSDAHYPTIAQMQSDGANAQSTGHPFIFLENPNTWDERLAADAGMYENWGLAMQRVWNVCEQYATIPGTFPFEWSDRAVQDPNSNASYVQYQSTGVQQLYDFPASGIHLLKMKGMVDAFRDLRPSVYELQNIYSPVQVSNALTVASGKVSFPVQNRYSFTDLSYLTTKWQLLRGGQVIASGSTNISVPALTTGNMQISLPASAQAYADTLRLDFLHPNGNDVQTYQFALTSPAALAQMTPNLPSGLPIPSFNLINRSIYNNPTLWTECERYPVSLTGVTLTPANATTLAQMTSLSATVIGGTTGSQVLGTIRAGFTNNVFSYTLNWTTTNWDVQELGWTFQMPANYSQFSWNRNARWTYYPSNDIGRASGTALPASTNVDITEMDIPNAFDFNSTKYSCTSASLTSSAGAGLYLSFGSQQLFDCRAGAASNGQGYVLYANQMVCPPNDISQNIVSDLTMTLTNGSVVQGSFTVGSNSNSVAPPAGAQPPSANVPANIVQVNDPGQCGAVVNFTLPAQTGNWAIASTNVSPASGSMFPMGTTGVTVIVTDVLGDSATNTFTVTVAPTQPPVVTTWPANQTLDVGGQCSVAIPDLSGQVVATDSCIGYNITQTPPPGTYVSMGVTNVIVTVADNSGNAVSNTVTMTVVDTSPAPTATYVDASYNNLPAGTAVTFPYTDGSGTHYVGCDAFGKIQAGINRVASGGAVNVAAGTYTEELTINQPLQLLGPNATNNPNTGSRLPEAIIQPDSNSPEVIAYPNNPPTYYNLNAVMVTIASSDVTIKGFTIDGYNPNLAGAWQSGSDRFNFGTGIGDFGGDNSIRIEDNIVQNYSYAGVDLESDYGDNEPNTNSCVKCNLIKNVDYNAEGYGLGITLGQDYYAQITDNCLTNVCIGISPQNYYLPNPGDQSNQTIANNTISATIFGIWLNLVYNEEAPNSTFAINNNTISFMQTNGSVMYGSPEWDGILITSIQSGVNVCATNNAIIGSPANVGYNQVGYNVWNTPTTGAVLINGGTVSNGNYGVWINNYDGYQSPGASTTATVTNIIISGASLAGIYVQDDPRASASGAAVQGAVTGNTVITGGGVGVIIQGTNAAAAIINNTHSITGNGIGVEVDGGKVLVQNNDLSGNTVAGIWVTNGAVADAGNCAGNNVTGLGVSTGGNNLSGYLTGSGLAVVNGNTGGSPTVLAQENNYGAAGVSDALSGTFSGSVLYSQASQIAAAPTNVTVQCASEVPAPATDLASFIAQGGYFSENSAAVTSSDSTSLTGNGTIFRTYTLTGSCAATNCTQMIVVNDTIPPYFTMVPTNMVLTADAGQGSKSNVTWSVTAADNCTLASVVSIPPSGSTFSVGTTVVTNIATDAGGNTTVSSFTVAVVNNTQPPVVTTWPANQTLDVGGQCSVAIPDLSGQIVIAGNSANYNITQTPAAGTYVSLGVTNVIVTVADNYGDAVSNTVTLTVVDTSPAPTATYVDASYNNLPAGAAVTFPYAGGSGTHYVGCDAFGKIQSGINRVASGGAVNVAAGIYTEELTISQPLQLLGPNATINPNTGSRLPEAIIQPDTNSPEVIAYPNNPPTYYNLNAVMVTIASSDVTIKGFTIDGYNPNLAGAWQSGSDRFNFGTGIGDFNGDSSIRIEDNIIQNDSYAGVDLESDYGYNEPNTNSCIECNLIKNIDYNVEGYGLGISLGQDYYARIAYNCLTNVCIGISPQNYYLPNPGDQNNQTIANNNITASIYGIWLSLIYNEEAPDSTFVINNNTVSFMPTNGSAMYGSPEWDGVKITFIQNAVNLSVYNNTIIGCASNVGYEVVGYNIASTPTTGNILIDGGSVSNANYGVWVNDYDGWPQSGGDGPAKVAISGMSIAGASSAGVYVQDDPQAGANVQAAVAGNTVINGSGVGVLVQGTHAKALIQNNDLTGNAIAGIWATNGAVVDAGNCNGNDVTSLGISAGGNNLSGYLTGSAKAVVNGNAGGLPTVLAEDDSYGAANVSDLLSKAFGGSVLYSQASQIAAAPTNVTVQCASEVPAASTDLAGFIAQGGYFSSDVATVTSSDSTSLTGNGTIIRTYTITGSCGAPTNCTQTIVVNDTIPPYFTIVPTNMVLSADIGQCSKGNVTWIVTAADNCTLASVVSVPPSGSTFPVGTTVVTNIATDASGNTTVSSFTVTVIDTQPPMFTSCAPTVTTNANATGYATIPDLTGSVVVSDNCSGVTLTQIPPAGTSESVGTYPVTIWAIDQSGNSNSCTTGFTVRSAAPPTWTSYASDVTVTILQAKDPYATGYPTASDISGPVTISYNDDRSGLTNCDSTGRILRTWTATDASNNATNYVQTVTVVDTNVPVFSSLPANITMSNDLGECSAVVNFGSATAMELGFDQGFEDPTWASGGAQNNPSTDWNDYNSEITRVPSGTDGIISRSGAAHAVIDSSVALLSDRTGAFSRLGGYSSEFGTGYRVSQDVYINLQDPGVVNATTSNGYGWDLSAASSDQNGNYLRDFIFHVAAYNSNGVVVAAGDDGSADSVVRGTDYRNSANYTTLTNSGWYTFQWVFRNTNNVLAVDMVVSDTNGTVLFTQTVSDPTELISTVVGGHRYLWFTFINADTLAIDNTILEKNTTVVPSIASGTAFPVGITTVTNMVTDACGNPAYATFNVTVIDVQPPSANVPANIVQANDPGQCGAVVNFTLPAQTDNCGVASVVATPASGIEFPVGVTSVTVVVTDIHGNSATNSFTVTVNDTEPPQITPPANIVQGVDLNQNYATVNFSIPTVSDNCGVLNVVATPPSGSVFPVGTNTVTFLATDIHGNTNYSTFTVTVVGLPQIISQPANVVAVAGDSVNFGVTVDGAAPVSYQWQKNGTNVPGANSSNLSFPSVAVSDVGSYQVFLTNLAGSQMSQPATLSVYTSTVPSLSLAYSNPIVMVTLSGVPTFTYAIQSSTNLLDWQSVESNSAPFTFTGTNANGYYGGFYRGVYLHR